MIDAVASMDESAGKVYVAVVNRNKEQPEPCSVLLDGFTITAARLHEYNFNDADNPDSISIRDGILDWSDDRLAWTFPPHSVSIIELDVK
jgi:alpha-L-arabinofuranosidase